jgi:hypothetical protein
MAITKRSSTEHDFTVVVRRVVERAIGEHLDGSPLEDPDAEKNSHAVALGRLGGQKGGTARAEKLTPRHRSRIAARAAQSRWEKKRG